MSSLSLLEAFAHAHKGNSPDFSLLVSISPVGPILGTYVFGCRGLSIANAESLITVKLWTYEISDISRLIALVGLFW